MQASSLAGATTLARDGLPRQIITTDAARMLDDLQEAGESLLAQAPPVIDAESARDLAQTHYGIDGSFHQLSSERDTNFRIKMANGASVLLKITNAKEDRAVTAMQTAAMMHLAAVDPELPVQRIYETTQGKAWAEIRSPAGESHMVRLISFIDGTVMEQARSGPGLFHHAGETLGRLALGLRGFFHPAAGRELLWDIKQAGHLWFMLDAVEETALQQRIVKILEHFDAEISARLPRLRAQVVHNDFNPHNVVVNGSEATRVSGIIDFGDMVHTPLICDLAVACSYYIRQGSEPFCDVADLLTGYTNQFPLEDEEIELLPYLMRMRHVITLVITAWRARRYPKNATYIRRNVPASLRGLDFVDDVGPAAIADILRTACLKQETI